MLGIARTPVRIKGCATPLDALSFLPTAYIPGLGAFKGEKLTVHGLCTPPSAFGGKGGAIERDTISEFGTHLGVASGRPFFPGKTGIPISPRQLTTDGVRITKQGVEKVERHLSRFDPSPQNQAQLQRLKDIVGGKIKPTQADFNNYTHELRESLRYKKLGYETGQPADPNDAYKFWNNLHTATLEDYGLKEGLGVLYHPDTEENEFTQL